MKKIYALLMLLAVMLTTLTMPAYGKNNHEAVVKGSVVGTWKLTGANSPLQTQEMVEKRANDMRNTTQYLRFKSDGSYMWITITHKNNKKDISRGKWYFEGDNLNMEGWDSQITLRLSHLSNTKMTIGMIADIFTVLELTFTKVPDSTISKYLK